MDRCPTLAIHNICNNWLVKISGEGRFLLDIIETRIDDVLLIKPSVYGDDRGFFIGLHTKKINNSKLKLLVDNLLSIDKN